MTKIGLLSDTHGFLDPAVFKHFKNCDEIWHGGDFGPAAVAGELAAFKPLKGVYGNIDGQDIRTRFPEIVAHRSQLFISGHSHILKVIYDPKLQCLHMNPGAAGNHGWHKVRTLIRFAIDGKTIRVCEVIELGKRR